MKRVPGVKRIIVCCIYMYGNSIKIPLNNVFKREGGALG